MCHSLLSSIKQSQCQVTEAYSRTKHGSVFARCHFDAIKILKVDNERTILASYAVGSIGVTTASSSDFDTRMRGTHDCTSDVLDGSRKTERSRFIC